MIAVDMKMTRKFFFQRGNFEVMNVEHEFSAFDGTSGALKGRLQQKARYLLANARIEAGTIVTLSF
jgi:hypothetical protein